MAPEHWGRDIRAMDVKPIGAQFNPDKFGVLFIWRRRDLPVGAGRYIAIDGQHRVRAVVDVMGWGDQQVPCRFYDGLTDKQAADLSLGLQTRRNLHAFDEHRMNLAAGQVRAVNIQKVLTEKGLTLVKGSARDHQVMAIDELGRIHDLVGTDGLGRVLTIMLNAWSGMASSLAGLMLRTVTAVVRAHQGDPLDDLRLAATLRRNPPQTWLGPLQVRDHMKRNVGHVAQEIVATYNTRLGQEKRLSSFAPTTYTGSLKRRPVNPAPRGTKVEGRLSQGSRVSRAR
jgi:hypothetical protein